jgi:hypothetical protein
LAGCATDSRRANNDPLLGGGPRTGVAAAGTTVTPPLPATTPGSTAALASITARPPDPRTAAIRIGDNPQGGVASATTQLRPPEPVARLTSNVPAPPAAPRVTSYEQAQTVLLGRGVLWQNLMTGEQGEWKFSCSLPNRQDPSRNRTYEGRGPTYLAAVQAVLDQVEKDDQATR